MSSDILPPILTPVRNGRGLLLHFITQRAVQLRDLCKIPIVGRDRVSDLEEARGPSVPGAIVLGQRALASLGSSLGEQFGVDQCIGHSVSGERILEVSGIANKRPTRSP
jgi:hypothetical protein